MPHLRKVYDGLLELERELGTLKRLVMQEREDIVRLDLNGMGTRRACIEEAFTRLQPLNARLGADIAEACRLCGIGAAGSLTPLIGAVPKPDREQFVQVQNDVQSLSASIDNELAVNRALLKDSLDFTAKSLGLFTSALKTTGTSTYGSAGRFVETAEQPRIICKEI